MDKKTAVRAREKWVDDVKVIACILVVLGHFFASVQSYASGGVLYEWFHKTIYFFHVPLFFICSGYLYQKYSRVDDIKSYLKNISKKALALGIPYVTFSSATWVLKTVFSRDVNNQIGGFCDTLFLHPTAPYWYLYACVVVYTTHGLTFPKGSSLKTKIVYGSVEWFCSWMTDGIITINWEDYAQMKKMRCKNVYHINGVGVDTSRYHECQIDRETYRKSLGLSENDIAILEVGELSTRKNHKVIIDALEKLADQRYVFLICGKAMSNLGTYDFLKKYAVEKNVRVIFLGFRKDIPEINRCADIAVLPSLREGLGLAGIEALASGVPVVGSDVQGIKDYVVDGETGYLCAPTDADAFAEKIKLLSDREVRSSMQKACVEKAEEFRLEISHQQMTDIYKNLLDGQEKSK